MGVYRTDLAAVRELVRVKRFEEGAAALEALGPATDPPRFELERQYLLGLCYRRLGRLDESLRSYEEVRRRDPMYKGVLREMSKVLAVLDPARAETYLTGALQQDPEDRVALIYRANARTRLEEYGGALEDVMEALRLSPSEVRYYSGERTLWDTLLWLGLRKMRDPESLRPFLDEIVGLYPKNKDAWRYRGKFLRETGDWRGAEEAYERALALAPDDAEVLWSMAHLYRKSGDRAGEARVLGRILEVSPDDDDALRRSRRLREAGEP